MSTRIFRKAARGLLALGAFGALAGAARAQAMTEEYTLQKLSQKADTIFIANCTKRETAFRDGNIVTRYTLKPSDVWKGTAKLNSAGDATLDQLGGVIDGPVSVGQIDTASVNLSEGQQVLLFVESAAPAAAATATAAPASAGKNSKPAPEAATLARVVGGGQGAFSVIQDPETGQKLVVPGTGAGRASSEKLQKAISGSRQAQAANEAAQAKRAAGPSAPQKQGAPQAKAATASADQIKPYEDLAAIKGRVKQLMNPTSSK